MLLYSIVDDYGVCDRDGVGDAVASVWLIADAPVWLIADPSVRLIDDASVRLIADALNGGGVWLIADASGLALGESTYQSDLAASRSQGLCLESFGLGSPFLCFTYSSIRSWGCWFPVCLLNR